MKKKEKRVKFNEIVRMSLRGYQLWWNQYPLILISSAVSVIVNAAIPFVGIYLSAQIINEIAGKRDKKTLIFLVVITLISAAILSLICAGLSKWKNYHHAGRYFKQKKFYTDKLLSMNFLDIDNPHTHDMVSQINQNDMWGGWGLSKLITGFEQLIGSCVTIISAFALTVSLFWLRVPNQDGNSTILNNPLFLVVIILLMITVTFITPVLSNKSESYWTKISEDIRSGNRFFFFYGFLGYDLKRALDMRMYRQDIISKKYNELDNGFGPKSKIASYARGPMGGLKALSAAISHLFTIIIYIFVCLKALYGAFGVGSVTQYIASITAMSGAVSGFISFFGDMRNNFEFLRTAFEFLDRPNLMHQGNLSLEKQKDDHYEIEFCNVSFKYPSANEYALKNISIKFKKGQRLAVVGQNGSGKTTFIKLLCRLYDPTDGMILLNGINIKEYDYNQYMSIFSVIFQDFNLLSYSLGQNVAAAREYDSKKVKNCLEKVGFGKRFFAMEKELKTPLYKDFDDNGIEISGGEAQKIALARALYKDAPFIILDEPTAALDPITEFEIYSKMNEMMDGKTAVFISHRLSSCRFCNDIAVFNEGTLIQYGSHDHLIADKESKYYELWNSQAQYYKNDNEYTA